MTIKMKQSNIYILITFLIIIGSVSFCQDSLTFQINKVTFTIYSIENNDLHWLDSSIIVTPNIPIMSYLNGNPPFDPYRTPWPTSYFYFWYFYLPYPDTLTTTMQNSVSEIDTKPKKIYLQKGKYVLKSDSKYADEINVTSFYSLSISFCDSTYKRNFIVLK